MDSYQHPEIDGRKDGRTYREKCVEATDHWPHPVLAQSMVHAFDETQIEPYGWVHSDPIAETEQPDQNNVGTSSGGQLALPSGEIPGNEGRQRRSMSAKERQINSSCRTKEQRRQIKEQKDRISKLLPLRKGRAPPSSELQLWTEASEYIERLHAENAILKEKTERTSDIPRSCWEGSPFNSTRIEPVDITGPSSAIALEDAWATSMAQATNLNWDPSLENYVPRGPSYQVRYNPIQETSRYLSESEAMPAPANLALEPFTLPAGPIWGPATSNYNSAPWNSVLGQHMQTAVRDHNELHQEVGLMGARFETQGSTERWSARATDGGTQDRHSTSEQQPNGYQGGEHHANAIFPGRY
ncbi:hypothetical protein SERLA73DRAFT_161669 [Serpula lacrymans var. lacrymans S7.3]|uniref:BHLH domain-containing protein n=2 Tax=Serpula lacrymans var. lacrymans TaxID=341189 RepID=F8Q4P9_SERL3|nr:uncharacterized protein SERLADRAFT_416713 [Serpula lacrymans var. lacrymans S7.9]EGN96526.1 hypothetical protein SERLA73DRAFT_161669 [Serpula lacrymans var. lacrymans S7.3]EGO22070.1 hypothetical protein SERLADRAFT_416713 [Serpula lacrymans var. lacrymans S7.9]